MRIQDKISSLQLQLKLNHEERASIELRLWKARLQEMLEMIGKEEQAETLTAVTVHWEVGSESGLPIVTALTTHSLHGDLLLDPAEDKTQRGLMEHFSRVEQPIQDWLEFNVDIPEEGPDGFTQQETLIRFDRS